MPGHYTYLVPVRLDVDGTQLVVCPWLDGDGRTHTDYWSSFCADCGTVVGESPAHGTIGVADVDGLPDAEYALIARAEIIGSLLHQKAISTGWVQPVAPVRISAGTQRVWGLRTGAATT